MSMYVGVRSHASQVAADHASRIAAANAARFAAAGAALLLRADRSADLAAPTQVRAGEPLG